jgi:hypothetical protein
MSRCRFTTLPLTLALVLAATVAQAREPDQIPPATAQPLSAIVRTVEADGHTVIPEIAFDDEVWKLRVYKAGLEYEIQVDPVSAEILGIRPVRSAKRATR